MFLAQNRGIIIVIEERELTPQQRATGNPEFIQMFKAILKVSELKFLSARIKVS